MKCKDVKPRLWDYLDAELTQEQMGEIGRHLQGCADCREHARALEAQHEQLGRLFAAAAPDEGELPSVAGAVFARLAAEQKAPSLWRRLLSRSSFAPAATMAVLFLITVAALTFYFRILLGAGGVAAPELRSSRQFAFTARPRHDGSVEASVTARRYAQIKSEKGWPR